MALSQEQKNAAALAQERQAGRANDDNENSSEEENDAPDEIKTTEDKEDAVVPFSAPEIIIMFFIAGFADLIQALAGVTFTDSIIFISLGIVVDLLIDFVVGVILFIWFKMKGISMSKKGGKLLLIGLASAFGIELIPFLDWLPAWTGYIITILLVQFIRYAMKNSRTAQRILKNRVLQ